jgi:hypothetical protein
MDLGSGGTAIEDVGDLGDRSILQIEEGDGLGLFRWEGTDRTPELGIRRFHRWQGLLSLEGETG